MGNNIWVMVVLGVLLVGMVVMTIIPQKKRQKQQQQMMSSLGVGTKIMTIGRMVGKIVSMNNADNTIVLNVGTEQNPTYITIEKNGVGIIMEGGITPVEPQPIPIEEEKKAEEQQLVENAQEEPAKSAAPAKKKAKAAEEKPAEEKPE